MKTTLCIMLLLLVSSCVSNKRMFLRGELSSPDVFYAESPFQRVHKLMVLEVEIGGKVRKFLFDTGAPMVISKELHEELNRKVLASRGVKDSQGSSQDLQYVTLPSLTLGGHTFDRLTAIVADLRLAPEIACLGIDGIIGANLMRHVVWSIDFQREMIAFSNEQGAFQSDSLAIRFPFLVKNTLTPVIEVAVNDTTFKGVTFDTGYGGSINLPYERAKAFAFQDIPLSVGYHSAGIFGSVMDTAMYLRVKVGNPDLALTGTPLVIEKAHGNDLIGISFLEHFRVVMDWKQQMISLFPQGLSEESPLYTYGMLPKLIGDTLIVGSVIAGGRADSLGMKVGDPIEELNGTRLLPPLKENSYCDLMSTLREAVEESITVKLLGQEAVVLPRKILF